MLTDYVWPDMDNTLRAFVYRHGGLVEPVTGFGSDLDQKIRNTWFMLGLNRYPGGSLDGVKPNTNKDNRWLHRQMAWTKASRQKEKLADADTPATRAALVDIAVERGMFSVWYSVFADDSDIKRRLVTAFKNTALDCFDDDCALLPRPGGQL